MYSQILLLMPMTDVLFNKSSFDAATMHILAVSDYAWRLRIAAAHCSHVMLSVDYVLRMPMVEGGFMLLPGITRCR